MSSQRSEKNDQVDPTNQFLHRARIRRLQGEAVRDAILTVSGRLDLKSFGPPVPQHLTAFMQGRGRPKTSGPIDGNGRRSIYLAVNRNFLSPFMLAFDVPAPVSTTGQRTSSNVPAQALILLNNEFVNQQAALWAEKLLSENKGTDRDVLAVAWFELLGRPALADEIRALREFVTASQPRELTSIAGISKGQLTEICHVLLNAKEFTFLR